MTYFRFFIFFSLIFFNNLCVKRVTSIKFSVKSYKPVTSQSDGDNSTFIVSVQVDRQHICVGSILNENWIVSAGYCVVDPQGIILRLSRFRIVYGTFLLDEINSTDFHPRFRKVKKIIIHPDYKQGHMERDIAVLQVKIAIDLTSFTKKIVLMDKSERSFYRQHSSQLFPTICYVYEWNNQNRNFHKFIPSIQRSLLRKVEITVRPPNNCTLREKIGNNENSSMLCGYGKNITTCLIDAGSPLVCDINQRTILMGVVPGAGVECDADFPTFFTSTSTVKRLIAKSSGFSRRKLFFRLDIVILKVLIYMMLNKINF